MNYTEKIRNLTLPENVRAEVERILAGPHKGGAFTLLHHEGPLLEYSYDVTERIYYILTEKDAAEHYTRLRHIYHIPKALDDDYAAKRNALYADYAAKLKPLDDDYAAKRKPLDDDYMAKRKALDADYAAKLKALDDDYAAKRNALYADYEAKLKPLYADYAAKLKPLDADYAAKLKPLDADYAAKRKPLDDEICALIPNCAWDGRTIFSEEVTA